MTGWFVSDDPEVEVVLDVCLCPGGLHPGGDRVWLKSELDAPAGLLIMAALAEATGDATMIEVLGRAYLLAGITRWTFCDSAGENVPVTRQNIQRLKWSPSMLVIANKASDLYGESLVGPLVEAASDSSPNGPSAQSNSTTP